MSETKQDLMKEIQSLDEIPEFKSEAQEAEFWATHSLGEEVLEKMESMPEGILPPSRTNSKNSLKAMQRYTLTDTHDRNSEVFEKAAMEPVLVTERSQPSHVIMSADTYQRLLKRLEELEDMLLGQAAETALKNSQMVGVETFTSTLQGLADGEA